jgi:WD40 repeat protein
VLDVNRPNPVYRFRGHMDEVNQLRFDPSRSLLASGSDDKSVRVWSLVGLVGPRANDREAEEGEDLPDLECRGGTIALRGHTTEVTMIEWMPKGGMGGRKRLLASCVRLYPFLPFAHASAAARTMARSAFGMSTRPPAFSPSNAKSATFTASHSAPGWATFSPPAPVRVACASGR